MLESNPRLLFLILFVSGLAVFLYWDRRKIQRHFILFYRRTKRGIELIDRIAERAPRFWNYYGWTGVVTGFLAMIGSISLVGYVIYNIFFGAPTVSKGVKESGFSFIAPGLGSEPQIQSGISFIPVEYWIIGVGIIMLVHELSHGIVARTENFEINSVGWVVMGIIPGAFVEPKGENMLPGDEENQDPSTGMWEQGTWTSRLKVLGAGSLANFVTAALFAMLAFGVTGAATNTVETGYIGINVAEDNGSIVYQTSPEFPAYQAGMRNGTLFSINDRQITEVEDIREVSENIEPNETVSIVTSEGSFEVKAVERKISRLKPSMMGYQGFISWLVSLIWTISWLNIAIGLFNMLPFKPLDGGLMADTVLKEYRESWVSHLDRFSVLGWTFILSLIILGMLI